MERWESLLRSGIGPLSVPQASILFLSTMTLPLQKDGCKELWRLLDNPKILEAFQAHVQLEIDQLETSSDSSSLNGYTISSFVEDDTYYLAILQNQELGQPEQVSNPATTKDQLTSLKPATWHSVQTCSTKSGALMKLTEVSATGPNLTFPSASVNSVTDSGLLRRPNSTTTHRAQVPLLNELLMAVIVSLTITFLVLAGLNLIGLIRHISFF